MDIISTPTKDKSQPPVDNSTGTAKMLKKYPKHHIAWGLIVALVLAMLAGFLFQALQQKIISTTYGKGEAARVAITANGIEPKELKIKVGMKVNWTNTDKRPHQVAADPFPTNDSIPNFNSTIILQEDDQSVHVFEQRGTFTYHDQQDPFNKAFHGTIVVE
jgi:plastocyanin